MNWSTRRVAQRSTRRAAQRSARSFLPEVQALRAVAVTLVVTFHLYPAFTLTRGGYVGVDVFFVISGYLITSHLLREVEATGRVRLGAFYARRARRLLPASLLVLLVSLGGALWLMPPDTWPMSLREVLASTFYVQNLHLAAKSVTYSAAGEVASPVQHYWSLSAEEQFYLVWPGLLLLALLLSRRFGRAGHQRPIRAAGIALVVTTLASFVTSVVWTQSSPAQAYFVTPTRAWEFGAGALVVLVLRVWAPPIALARLLRLGGLAAILASCVLLTQQTPFPGWVALLPVAGTAAVIIAGMPAADGPARGEAGVHVGARWAASTSRGLDRLVEARATQWLGRISYSVYLWHWPLIVLVPYLVHELPLRWFHKLAIAALTLALAHATQRWVEDATRHLPSVRRSTRRSLTAAFAGMLVLVAAVAAGTVRSDAEAERVAAAVAAARASSCVGAVAGLDAARCPRAFTDPPLGPVTAADYPLVNVAGCSPQTPPGDSVERCPWAKRGRTLALIGDSHAQQLVPALKDELVRRGIDLLVLYRPECPATLAPQPGFLTKARDPELCAAWTRRALVELAAAKPVAILTTAYFAASTAPSEALAVQGFHDAWAAMHAIAPVFLLRDQPGTQEQNMPECLALNRGEVSRCTLPRGRALLDSVVVRAVASAPKGVVTLLDLTDAYCDPSSCYPVVGGLPVYADRNHLAIPFARTLAPMILDRVSAAVPTLAP